MIHGSDGLIVEIVESKTTMFLKEMSKSNHLLRDGFNITWDKVKYICFRAFYISLGGKIGKLYSLVKFKIT